MIKFIDSSGKPVFELNDEATEPTCCDNDNCKCKEQCDKCKSKGKKKK